MIQIKVSIKQESVQLYQHRKDEGVFGGIRSCAPCPAVFVLKGDPHSRISRQWQYYLLAINYNMTPENVASLLHYRLAYCNFTGLGHDSDPRANFITGDENTTLPLPNHDKVRTNSLNVLTGTEQLNIKESIRLAFKDLYSPTYKDGRRQLRFAATRNMLNVVTFDSRKNPPLKPGRTYPRNRSEINPDDYLYMPQTHRHMFLVANVVKMNGDVYQFPRGATYPWVDDGLTPYSFLPHINNYGYGAVLYPLDYLRKLPLGSPVPRPYTI